MGRSQQDVRALGVKDLRLALVQHHAVVIPTTSLKEKTVNIGAILRLQVWCFLQKLEIIGDLVDRDGVPSGKVLQHTSEEALREEKSRNPENCGISNIDPLLEEREPSLEV